jgi:hypothetical protein
VAVHKGAIIRPAVIRGTRRPEFQVNLPPVQGAYFDLFGPRDQRRTIVIQADASVRASNQRSMVADSQAIVVGNIEGDSDTWLIIPQAFEQLTFAAVRVTHPRQAMLDTALRISGYRALTADTGQRLEQQFGRSADAGLAIFNVIINEEHEIQT